MHATAAEESQHSETPPLKWTADEILVGSFSDDKAKANYNGKYFEQDDQLFLTYSKELSEEHHRDGIVAQKMKSPTEKAAEPPVILLEPSDGGEAKNSEFYFPDSKEGGFKLVETCNITKINGKFALAYSVGAFNRDNYKLAVAWSDTFLPPSGKTYRKVTKPDPGGVWSKNKRAEVVYLLQTEKPNWPNFARSKVLSPGVPTIAQVGDGPWVIVFAGYDPSDAPKNDNGTYSGDHRRPYYVEINVKVPSNKSVSEVSQAELASWITLAR